MNFEELVLRAQKEFEFNSFSAIIFFRQSLFSVLVSEVYTVGIKPKINGSDNKNIGNATIAVFCECCFPICQSQSWRLQFKINDIFFVAAEF